MINREPRTQELHQDLKLIIKALAYDSKENLLLNLFQYQGEKDSGSDEVCVLDDKFLGSVEVGEDHERAIEIIEKLLIPRVEPGREAVLSSTRGDGEYFLPVLDLLVFDGEELWRKVNRFDSVRLRTFLRDLNPMVFRTGNSLHLYGQSLLPRSEFQKFCGQAILDAGEIIDTRWVAHSLVRGEFHFRISHLTGLKRMRPCRDPEAEEKLKLCLDGHQDQDQDREERRKKRDRTLS